MLTVLVFALIAGAPQVATAATPAEPFTARVTRAKLMEAGPTGPDYQASFWHVATKPMTDTLRGCIDSNAPADKSPFTLVADLSPDGQAQNIQVQPATPVAKCLAGQFVSWKFPAPPKLSGELLYPIEIDVSL